MLVHVLAHFTLHTDGITPTLTVNGSPVEGFSGVQVVAVPGEVTQLLVKHHGSLELEGDGIVHVHAEGQQTGARDEVKRWLAALDGKVLEQQALDSSGWGSAGLGDEVLRVLGELADGLPE